MTTLVASKIFCIVLKFIYNNIFKLVSNYLLDYKCFSCDLRFTKSNKKKKRRICYMGQSRQRQYPTVDSSLNVIRELIILLFSITFCVRECKGPIR